MCDEHDKFIIVPLFTPCYMHPVLDAYKQFNDQFRASSQLSGMMESIHAFNYRFTILSAISAIFVGCIPARSAVLSTPGTGARTWGISWRDSLSCPRYPSVHTISCKCLARSTAFLSRQALDRVHREWHPLWVKN